MTQLAEALASSFQILLRLVVPLYADIAARPALVGSGFFISRGRDNILVSAGHVLQRAKTERLYFYATPDSKRYLSGRITTSAYHGSRKNAQIDLAAVALDGKVQPPYPEVDKFALTLSNLRFASTPSATARYGLIGFPASRSRVRIGPREVRVQPYGHLAESASLREYAVSGLDPTNQLYLVFNRRKSFGLDGQGRSFPKPHGLSGAPIFEIYDEANISDAGAFPLAGVVTDWHPAKHRLLGAASEPLRELIETAA